MFCIYCGSKLEPGAKFCTKCGARIETEDNTSPVVNEQPAATAPESVPAPESIPAPAPAPTYEYSQNTSYDPENNSNPHISPDNIERFGVLAAFAPLALFVISFVLSIFNFIPNMLGVGYIVMNILYRIVDIIFVCLAAVATGGLVWVAATKRNPANIWAWVAPITTFFAFISCLIRSIPSAYYGNAGLKVFAWLLLIVCAVIGIELFARVTINKMPMDTPMNFGAAFASLKNSMEKSKAASQAEKAADPTAVNPGQPVNPAAFAEVSYFDGSGLSLFGYSLLAGFVSGITCGLAAPWMICMVYKWRVEHTVINGKRLTFTGNGGSLFGHWILWSILTVITCGIYGLFVHVALRRWELERTYLAGEAVVAGDKVSTFDGGTLGYIGYSILASLLCIITCGLAYPWAMCMLQKWDTSHQIINGRHLKFSGTGIGFLGEFIIIFLLSLITCGLYTSWGIVRMNKYVIRHTDFEA